MLAGETQNRLKINFNTLQRPRFPRGRFCLGERRSEQLNDSSLNNSSFPIITFKSVKAVAGAR